MLFVIVPKEMDTSRNGSCVTLAMRQVLSTSNELVQQTRPTAGPDRCKNGTSQNRGTCRFIHNDPIWRTASINFCTRDEVVPPHVPATIIIPGVKILQYVMMRISAGKGQYFHWESKVKVIKVH